MPELKQPPCPNDSIVEACTPWVEAIDGTNSKGLVGPCKFCGHSAWLQPYNEGRNYQAPDSHPTGVFAQCANSKCRATMHRMQCWVDDAHTALEEPQLLVEALLARWNTRPDGGDSLREALEAEVRQLETDKAQLMAFATHFIQAGAWDAVEPDGGDIQDTAAKYGLLKEVKATEENAADWGHMADVMEVGDTFYVLAGPLAAKDSVAATTSTEGKQNSLL